MNFVERLAKDDDLFAVWSGGCTVQIPHSSQSYKETFVTKSDVFRRQTNYPESSDQTIAAEAQRRLSASGYVALQSVRCECRNRAVTLSGQLPSYYLKQLAQAKVLAVPFVTALVNNIEVLS